MWFGFLISRLSIFSFNKSLDAERLVVLGWTFRAWNYAEKRLDEDTQLDVFLLFSSTIEMIRAEHHTLKQGRGRWLSPEPKAYHDIISLWELKLKQQVVYCRVFLIAYFYFGIIPNIYFKILKIFYLSLVVNGVCWPDQQWITITTSWICLAQISPIR